MNKLKIIQKILQIKRASFKKENLWITNTVSSGVLLALGDSIQQKVERLYNLHPLPHYDWNRTGRLFLVGLAMGPPHHVFYLWLDKVLPSKSFKTISKKVLLDQIIAAPCFAFIFFVGAGLLEGKNGREALEEFKRKFPAVYLFDWFIWPPSQAINFLYVPIEYRVLYINAVTVLWDIFLSYMKHKDQHKKADDENMSKEKIT